MFKKIFLFSITFLFVLLATAQFKSATLQAAGLTCAMCSRAVHKSLEQLPFVQQVEPNIKNSSYQISFKPGMEVNIDGIKNAVEDAGFSVASLKLTGAFNNISVKKDEHIRVGNTIIHFLNAKTQILNGERTITIVDKNFLSDKAFRKFASATTMLCVQSGKAESCCQQHGIRKDERVYHATVG